MKSEPIPAVDYEVEVRKVWPDAICVLAFHSGYRVQSELNDEWKNLSSFFATPAEAWADAYSKLPQPTAAPGGDCPELDLARGLYDTLSGIADFAVVYGDVCEIIARRARTALRAYDDARGGAK